MRLRKKLSTINGSKARPYRYTIRGKQEVRICFCKASWLGPSGSPSEEALRSKSVFSELLCLAGAERIQEVLCVHSCRHLGNRHEYLKVLVADYVNNFW
jgi:hypothetical protein